MLEDACQAHLGEWRGRKVGTWGDLGCFSFQASKNLNSGEGGAIMGNDAKLIEAAKASRTRVGQLRTLVWPGRETVTTVASLSFRALSCWRSWNALRNSHERVKQTRHISRSCCTRFREFSRQND